MHTPGALRSASFGKCTHLCDPGLSHKVGHHRQSVQKTPPLLLSQSLPPEASVTLIFLTSFIDCSRMSYRASVVVQMVKNLSAMQETQVGFLGWEDVLEKGITTHSSIFAWRIPWTEEPGGLQPEGSQRVTDT